jgi:hypothetical protein
MPEYTPAPEHEATFQDLIGLIKKHDITPPEMLAIAANMVGKLLAMQDQRTMSKQSAMRIVTKNIEIGNQQVIDQLRDTKGNA